MPDEDVNIYAVFIQTAEAEEDSEKGGEEMIAESPADTTSPVPEDNTPASLEDTSQDNDSGEANNIEASDIKANDIKANDIKANDIEEEASADQAGSSTEMKAASTTNNTADKVSAAEEEASADQVESSTEMKAVSTTNNIVGEVFARIANESWKKQDAEECATQYRPGKYPQEHHERSWYGDSPRVRDLSGGNYLVYRDSFLLVSKEDTAGYSVSYSDDERTAYVSPGFSDEQLKGRTGIVFLTDFVGDDTILVFDGTPHREDGTLVVPLAATKDITASQLFSDAKLSFSITDQNAGSDRKRKSPNIPGIDWNYQLSGTNWSGEITDGQLSAPKR